MLLRSLTVQNFKGIGEPALIEFKPITLLFGANSTGKSTILQALHYAREIFVHNNPNADRTESGGKALDLGGFHRLIHNHDLTRSITLGFELAAGWDDLPRYLPDERADIIESRLAGGLVDRKGCESPVVEVMIEFDSAKLIAIVDEYEVRYRGAPLARMGSSSQLGVLALIDLNHPMFQLESDTEKPTPTPLRLLAESLLEESVFEANPFALIVTRDGKPGLPDLDVSLEIPFKDSKGSDFMEKWDTFNELMSRLILGPGKLLREALTDLQYLGPLREVPPRNFQPPLSPDASRRPTGLGAWDSLYRSETGFQAEFNDWLGRDERMATGYRVEIKDYKELDAGLAANIEERIDERFEGIRREIETLPVRRRLLLRDTRTDLELEPQDVGVGISQVIPVIVLALGATKEIVAIEQPELHVHPAMQVELGDLFASRISGEDGPLFVIETHSEHLILRFLRRIRETSENELPPGAPRLRPDDIAVYYFEMGSSGVAVTQLRIDESGEFKDQWPKGFFEERVKELF